MLDGDAALSVDRHASADVFRHERNAHGTFDIFQGKNWQKMFDIFSLWLPWRGFSGKNLEKKMRLTFNWPRQIWFSFFFLNNFIDFFVFVWTEPAAEKVAEAENEAPAAVEPVPDVPVHKMDTQGKELGQYSQHGWLISTNFGRVMHAESANPQQDAGLLFLFSFWLQPLSTCMLTPWNVKVNGTYLQDSFKAKPNRKRKKPKKIRWIPSKSWTNDPYASLSLHSKRRVLTVQFH